MGGSRCVTPLPHTTPSTTTPVSMSPIPFCVQKFSAPPVTSCDNLRRDLPLLFASHPSSHTAGHHVLHPPHSGGGGGVMLVGTRAFQGFLDSYMAPKAAMDVPLLLLLSPPQVFLLPMTVKEATSTKSHWIPVTHKFTSFCSPPPPGSRTVIDKRRTIISNQQHARHTGWA